VDVTRDDEGRAVVQKLYGGLQSVGVALGKEQSQIVAAHFVELLADGIDLIAEEVGELIHVGISFSLKIWRFARQYTVTFCDPADVF
jgi:hypothetical protein